MKQLCIAFFVLASISSYAQQQAAIIIDLQNAKSTEAAVSFPVNGSFWTTQVVYQAGQEHKIIVPNSITKAGLVNIIINYKGYKLFVEPNQDYSLVVDAANKEQPFAITGTNAEGQNLLNRLKHPDYSDKGDSYAKKDTTIEGIESLIAKDADNEKKLFADLRNDKKINEAFYRFASKEIDYYYAAAMSAVIYNNSSKPGFAEAWPRLFAAYSMSDIKSQEVPSFYDYIDQYVNWYKGSYTSKLNGTFKVYDTRKSNEYLLVMYKRYADNLPEPAREYALARFLKTFLTMKKYEPELVQLFEDFNKSYPASSYTSFFREPIQEIVAFHEKAGKDFTAEQKVVNNYLSVASLDELGAMFKGKTVFVDIWATWCSPCKEEFKHNDGLKKFLKQNNAEVLYLSIDDEYRDQQWKDMIKFYNLSGTHIRVSDSLKKELIDVIWKNKQVSIPRYLIIKDGKLVETNAKRPSDKDELYRQISAYL
ncbi:MAG: TlpA disulfide reductase family protein [Chitinophagaceae bacterium]